MGIGNVNGVQLAFTAMKADQLGTVACANRARVSVAILDNDNFLDLIVGIMAGQGLKGFFPASRAGCRR